MRVFVLTLFVLLLSYITALVGRNVVCPEGKIRICGCFSCHCYTLPKCPEGQVAKCSPVKTLFKRCRCVAKEEPKTNTTIV